jgi:phospholipase A1
MKKYLPLLLSSLCFAENINILYLDAQKLEQEGNYKEAMLLYKKAANLNIPKEEANINSTQESFTTLKKAFYEKQIDKVEDKETNENIKQSITKSFELYPYRKNYILPATYDFNKSDDDKQQFETLFQISIEKPISYDYFGLNETVSASYTQKSFWQTGKHSFPFRETNYEPELFVSIPYENNSVLKSYKLGFNHFSNGKGDETSRSWNRLFLEGTFQLSELFIVPKVWYRLPEGKDDNNPDIQDYYGYGDLTFVYSYQKHQFELTLRNNLEFYDKNRGSAEFNWTFPLPRLLYSTNTYGLFQVFSGYGNSLIDYDRETNKVGLGIALSR